MDDEQPANATTALIESLERALAIADELQLPHAAIYINQALVALGVEPPVVYDFRMAR
jgi:hypothetical protein